MPSRIHLHIVAVSCVLSVAIGAALVFLCMNGVIGGDVFVEFMRWVFTPCMALWATIAYASGRRPDVLVEPEFEPVQSTPMQLQIRYPKAPRIVPFDGGMNGVTIGVTLDEESIFAEVPGDPDRPGALHEMEAEILIPREELTAEWAAAGRRAPDRRSIFSRMFGRR